MCAIVGAVLKNPQKYTDVVRSVVELSLERGSDSYGHVWLWDGCYDRCVKYQDLHSESAFVSPVPSDGVISTFIAQLRAEPTHEYVKKKREWDVAPFSAGNFWVAHNGTVANDMDYSDPTRRVSSIDSESIANRLYEHDCMFELIDIAEHLKKIDGSYAVLIGSRLFPGQIIVATNYKPLYYLTLPNNEGYIFASQESYLRSSYGRSPCDVRRIAQYSIMRFSVRSDTCETMKLRLMPVLKRPPKVLMLCSGGLDAAVATTMLVREAYEVLLLNYDYGQRAADRERMATKAIAMALDCEWVCTSLALGVKTSSSTLLDASQRLSSGSAGAERPCEWVPARNLIMLSNAVALAEAEGFNAVAVGINLEESNSYPDNEMEFINRFNQLLPYAIAPGREISILMPVGSMMKRHIVQTGHELGAPMEWSYSCYAGGEIHCGVCASCYLRRSAFRIAGVNDPTIYQSE